MALKVSLLKTLHSNRNTSWQNQGFLVPGDKSSFGAGKLSMSVGIFAVGHKVGSIIEIFRSI